MVVVMKMEVAANTCISGLLLAQAVYVQFGAEDAS